MKNEQLTKAIPCLIMAWVMLSPKVVAQEINDCKLICQFFEISPPSNNSDNSFDIEIQKKMEMELMAQHFRQIKKERNEQRWNAVGAALMALPGAIQKANQEREMKQLQKEQAEQEAIAKMNERREWLEANDRRPKTDSYRPTPYASPQKQQQQYYNIGTSANGQLESAKMLENIAISRGESRYVSESEILAKQKQDEGQTVIGIELVGDIRISHTLKVDYRKDIPKVKAIRYTDNGPGGYGQDHWFYINMDAEQNRVGVPKECKWFIRINGKTIYF